MSTKELQELETKLTNLLQDQAKQFKELADKDALITCQKASIDTLTQDCSTLQTQLLKVAPGSSSIAHWIRPQPPKFSGKPTEDPVKFIRDLEKYFKDIQAKDATWFGNVPFTLTSCAKSWFDANSGTTFRTYATFKKEFLEYFSEALTDDERLVLISKRTQRPGEPFPDFAWAVYEMFNGFDSNKADDIRVERIIENSDPAIRIHLRTLKRSDYNMKAIVDLERKIRRDLGPNHPYIRSFQLNSINEAPKIQDSEEQQSQLQSIQQQKTSPVRYCHYCMKPNHFARDCPDRKAGVPRTRQLPSTPSPNYPRRTQPRPQYLPRMPMYPTQPQYYPMPYRQYPRPPQQYYTYPQYQPRPGNLRQPGMKHASQAYRSYHVQPSTDVNQLPALMDIPLDDFVPYEQELIPAPEPYSNPPMAQSSSSQDFSDNTSLYTS